MTSQTASFFDDLYDQLRVERPNLKLILTMVEDQLKAGTCVAEKKAAKDQLIKFLSSLQQFFTKNKNSQKKVEELIQTIEKDGELDLTKFGRVLQSLMAFTIGSSPLAGYSSVPISFMGRIAQIFPQSANKDPGTQTLNQQLTMVGEQQTVNLAAQAIASEKAWQQKLLLMGRQLIAAYPAGHLVDYATTQFFAGNPVDGTRKSSQKLEILLRQQLLGYHRISGALRSKMSEGRAKANRLRDSISQLEESIVLSQKSQFIDPQTGIPSRSSFTAHLYRHLERALHLGELFSISLIHIQDFSNITAKLQKAEEQQFIKTVATLVRSQLQDVDFLAQLGVDRFAMIFPEATHKVSGDVTSNIGTLLNSTEFNLSNGIDNITVKYGSRSFTAGMTAQDMLQATDNLADLKDEPVDGEEDAAILKVREA
ncbi:MAG: diguanylate cyclase [Magnetococcales bacterium]|nr:diguanylate cyclase [Magnetococcales bacterium]